MATLSMKQLLESGIHFGHQTRRWNPKMARYIFGERHGIYIIDLQQTLRQMQKAYRAVRDTVAQGGDVLFVGTKKQARDVVKQQAERCGMFYINNRWLGGTLTNWQTIQKSIETMTKLQELESSGKIEAFSKKEAIVFRKRREKLEKNLSGIQKMGKPPAIMFVVDSHREGIAVNEASRLNIPCVAICDTNSDPDAVTIPVPGNDDAIRAINLFCDLIADAALEGRMQYEKNRSDEASKAKQKSSGETVQSDKLAKQKEKAGEEPAAEAAAEAAPAKAEATDAAAPADPESTEEVSAE